MKFGVPQGSVLGPLLFLIFINDITKVSNKFHFTLFADDTCITANQKTLADLENLVNTELVKIEQWLINNRLSLNIDKSCFLLFSGKKRQDRLNLKLAGKDLNQRKTVKYLGIMIDDKLTWKDQIEHVIRKIKQGSGIMKRTSYLVSYPVICSLFHSFIQCHIRYGLTAWGSPMTKGLTKITNIVDKIVNKINKYKPLNANTFKPLDINALYKLESCKLVYQYFNNKLPSPLNCLFSKTNQNHNHITRQANTGITTVHLDQAILPIMHFAPSSWNTHCRQIQQSSTLSNFSSLLKHKLAG